MPNLGCRHEVKQSALGHCRRHADRALTIRDLTSCKLSGELLQGTELPRVVCVIVTRSSLGKWHETIWHDVGRGKKVENSLDTGELR